MEQKKYAIIILGASGDLAKRKLIPALERLFTRGEIDSSTIIVGSGRTDFSDEAFRSHCGVSGPFAHQLFYHKNITGLRSYLSEKGEFGRIIIFMSLPPQVYAQTAAELSAEGFERTTSIIIEKPFGFDYESAVELNKHLTSYFNESNIYRNDHYLAKEAVQNILVFRFANALFYPFWNNTYIESIQISSSEIQGVGKRGNYFDHAGIIRDMVQNHLMQMLCLITMDPPLSLLADDISARKIEVLRTIHIDQCFRSQYEGYSSEPGVQPASKTETFAELKLSIDNPRWAGVPVYLRSGKALNRDGTHIGVRFKRLPISLFNEQNLQQNTIVFTIQPMAGILMRMVSKVPGDEMILKNTNLTFCYHSSFGGEIPEAYQRLLLDAIHGDHTLFVDAHETELSWQLLGSVLDTGSLDHYPQGTMPQTKLAIEWIDFKSYHNTCLSK